MMATEATSETLATTSTTPDIPDVSPSNLVNDDSNTVLTLRQNSIPETSSQDGSSESVPSIEQPINGIVEKDGTIQDTTEAAVTSAEVSVSGGSDTEASKAEATKTALDKGHVRSASVKKPASFKPVSVNKTFLAAKVASSAAPSKLGDKPVANATTAQTASTLAAPRPRLVAKTGSGLRDSTPRTSSAGPGGKAGAAPDASAVWNKNRRVSHFHKLSHYTNFEQPHLLQSLSDLRTKNSSNVMVYTWLRDYNLMILANKRIGQTSMMMTMIGPQNLSSGRMARRSLFRRQMRPHHRLLSRRHHPR
jgi:hypothetical protein